MIDIDYTALPNRSIIFLDIKSFFASVECIKHKMDPLTSYLVVCGRMHKSGGLVLASTPKMKQEYNIKTGSRQFQIPKWGHIKIVPPRMDLYLYVNSLIIKILKRFVADEDLLIYSIDEMCLDVTDYQKLWGDVVTCARTIQETIKKELWLTSTVGIGPNPLLAKIAMDTDAKKNPYHFARWTYEDVATKLQSIRPLSKMWGIGGKTEEKLNDLGIYSVGDLANYDLDSLKALMGVMGEEIFYHAWGVDYTVLNERKNRHNLPTRKSNISFGSSEILERDYSRRFDIETVLMEKADIVSKRLRKHKKLATVVKIGIGFSKNEEDDKGFSRQMKIEPTNNSKEFRRQVIELFRRFYRHEVVRRISVTACNLISDDMKPFNLFDDLEAIRKQERLDKTVDHIQSRYGFKSLVMAYSLKEAGTAIARSSRIGGHETSVRTVH